MTDADAFIAAICANPADDTARGAFADWLQEHDDPEWAEYIRVGVELANWRGCEWKTKHVRAGYVDCNQWNELIGEGRTMTWCPPCSRREQLRARSDTLLPPIEARLRRGAACEQCSGSGHLACGRHPSGHTCEYCSGTGWAGVLGETKPSELSIGNIPGGWLIPARWSRGFPSSITCPLAWWMQRGRQCVREWPVTEVECSDRYALLQNDDREIWMICRAFDSNDQDHWSLPPDIFDKLEGADRSYPIRDPCRATKFYYSEPAARAALSAALLAWATEPEPVRRG